MSTKEDFVTELFNQYYPMLRTLCWRYVDYDRLFADIVDESILDTFIQAYSSYDHLRSHPNVQGWLIITCLNRLKPRVKQVRNREKHHAFSMDDPHVPQIKLEESWEEFWTVLDIMLWYNSSVKDDGSGLSFDDELLPAQLFSPVTEQFTLYRMSVTLAR